MARRRQIILLDPAPPWQGERSEYLVLWHGCTSRDKDQIEGGGIDLAECRADADFGRGFYMTTIRRQAAHWAWERVGKAGARGRADNPAVLLRFRVSRVSVAKLQSLHFVLGDSQNDDFWSLVQHCRESEPATARGAPVTRDHKGPRSGWYDVVAGPVAAFWAQRVAMAAADQVSFHTPGAIRLLNDLIRRGSNDYRWEVVVQH